MTAEHTTGRFSGVERPIKIGDYEVQVQIIPEDIEWPSSMLVLTEVERAWLEAYCIQLQEHFPDCVEQVIVYGPRAEGYAHSDLELNTLVVICEDDGSVADRVSDIGLELDMSDYFVAPSITVRTSSEWDEIRQHGDPLFQPAVDAGVKII
ncbi:MAG: hypothetical protein OXD31_16435 [Chloroflexi bacterium]|nr:hypothetical protein [Chloroflexota bacterium]